MPCGGPVRTELEDFATKLKDVQSTLATAAASLQAFIRPESPGAKYSEHVEPTSREA